MTERMAELLRIARLQNTLGDDCKEYIEAVDGRKCCEIGFCEECIAATIDAIERELEEHHVELPVRIKARQAIERENSVLYGYLNDAAGSRDAWAEKYRRANQRAQDLQAREAQLVSLLRDARDEYVQATEGRGRNMLHFAIMAIGATVGFMAAAIITSGRDR